ncbi:OmpP1/FadL family transporter [Rhodovulum sp. YNF3179]|uniref:OmpP1/FadL family transporter n=1 Tax=Rhodovulum sp. YNF3179 TaxID=3425127 RepID=UPI003D333184
MKRLPVIMAALAASATAASAGGIDRSGQGIGVIFEEGNYAQLSFGSVTPDVSGTDVGFATGASSGDMTGDYTQFGAAYKHDFGNGFSAALIFDQPFGADVDYPAGTGYFAQATTAELDSNALTALVKYTTAQNFSVYGGLRYQTLSAKADIPFATAPAGVPFPGAPYSVNGERDGALGYLVGAAYERPDIALRVALTYNSPVEHELPTTESSVLGPTSSTTSIETPQSLNLDFQTGIAEDTLLFGSARWVEWSEFVIAPQAYQTFVRSPLISYDDDTITYSLGLGRRFNENWSGAVTLGYEPATGGYTGNLGPTDGFRSIGVGATYTRGNMKITGGVRYVDIGDAESEIASRNIAPAGDFDDNHAVGVGLQVGFSF